VSFVVSFSLPFALFLMKRFATYPFSKRCDVLQLEFAKPIFLIILTVDIDLGEYAYRRKITDFAIQNG
jgi:hypothetical protein